MSRGVAAFALVQFAAILGAVAFFLWQGEPWRASHAAVWLVALCASVGAVGAAMRGRLSMLEVLVVEAGALAMATLASGHPGLHQFFKPLAMVLAIAFVLRRGIPDGRFAALLVAGLALSLVGDVFLMLPDRFLPGLVSFLLAHLCYIAVFRRGVPWFPNRWVLAGTLAVAAAMMLVLWPRLQPVLQIWVGAYAVAIALMAAQAIGRALVLRDRAALGVAVGAAFFVVSDALLAIDRFAAPIPLAPLWVLGTYYVAQLLIARNARPVPEEPPAVASRLQAS